MTPTQFKELEKILSDKQWDKNPLHDSMKNRLFKLLSKLNNDEGKGLLFCDISKIEF